MKSKIGIVVPIGRYSPMLGDTLNSIIRQDVGVEIAVFDASNDPRTKDMLEQFSANLAYVHYGADGGQANAIRMGWDKLDTEIVSWLNDDDSLAPGTLKKAIEFIENNPSCTGVYGPSVILDEEGIFSGMHPAVDPERLDEIFSNNAISQPSCFIKHSYIKDIGGINKNLHFTMDWDLWTRLLSEFPDSIGFSEDVLTAVTFSNQTKTAAISFRRMREIYRITRRYNPLKKSLVTVLAFFQWGVLQRVNSGKKDKFFKSPTHKYAYWSYNKSIVGITLNGSLTPQNIKEIENRNEMNLIFTENDLYQFNFNKHFDPRKIVRILLKDIDCYKIEFRFF